MLVLRPHDFLAHSVATLVRSCQEILDLLSLGTCQHGGKGWLLNDSYFYQQVVGDDKAKWLQLNQSLYAVIFIAQGYREKGRSCTICLESNHLEEWCAL